MNQNSNFGDVLVCHWYAPVLSEPILPSTVICFPGRSATLIKHIKLKLPTSPNILFRSLFLAPFTSFRACECRPDHPAGTSPIRERRVENWGSAHGLRGHAAMAPRPFDSWGLTGLGICGHWTFIYWIILDLKSGRLHVNDIMICRIFSQACRIHSLPLCPTQPTEN